LDSKELVFQKDIGFLVMGFPGNWILNDGF